MVVLVWSLFQYHLLTDRHMGLCKVQVSKAVPDTVDIELVVAEPVQHQTSKYQPRQEQLVLSCPTKKQRPIMTSTL